MALDDVMSFLRWKDVTYATQSNYWRNFLSAMAEGWKKLKTSNVFSSFNCVLKYRNRSALLRELLSNNSFLSVSCTKINHSCCALMI